MTDYRPEIDGLRALAVLPVMLFHAGFQIFSGGFVGVDVFFVISGYLITTIILAELETGKFSIISFYERRARRILPALLLVMCVCLPFAWLWLLPPDMKNFSRSLAAVSVFASNILFWRTSGYFSSAAELNPLLHTWSLAVEEQFYVFFPIFLILTWRLGNRWMLGLLGIVFMASLGLAQRNSIAYPAAAFYLLQTRGWELLIGSFVAIGLAKYGNAHRLNGLNEAGGCVGIALISCAIFLFDKRTPFPGFYALVPACGAALILLCATKNNNVGKFLGKKLFVGIGLISYSAYLWHQPLIAFAKHRSLEEPGKALLGFLVVLSILLAYLSWKYIETPFRDKGRFSRAQIFASCGLVSCLYLVLGLIGQFNSGYQWRFGHDQVAFWNDFDNRYPDWKYYQRTNWADNYRIKCDFYDIPAQWAGNETRARKDISPDCFVRDVKKWNKSVFLWGDSHVQHFYPGLRQTLPSDWQIQQVGSSGCRPSLQYSEDREDYCEHSNYFALKMISETKPDVVLIGQQRGHSVVGMEQFYDELRRAGVKRIIFVGPSPYWKSGGLPTIVAFRLWEDIPLYAKVGLDMNVLLQDTLIKEAAWTKEDAKYISLIDYLCNSQGCRVYWGDNVRDGITSYDYGHLTPIASYYFARDVLSHEIVNSPEREGVSFPPHNEVLDQDFYPASDRSG